MTMEKAVSLTFPTPVGRYRLPQAEVAAINGELRRIILDRERAEPSQDYANAGGWHSKRDLLEWGEPAIDLLRKHLLEAVEHIARSAMNLANGANGRPIELGPPTIRAWANVSRRGDYHRLHNHPRSCWSGVYYVSVGTSAPSRPLSGLLELTDPRPFTEMVSMPGDPFGQKLAIPPAEGTIILFPSWMYHFVNPYEGDGERISIAFNANGA
jgi:uncharacterized protein (TIGR02466 family)